MKDKARSATLKERQTLLEIILTYRKRAIKTMLWYRRFWHFLFPRWYFDHTLPNQMKSEFYDES